MKKIMWNKIEDGNPKENGRYICAIFSEDIVCCTCNKVVSELKFQDYAWFTPYGEFNHLEAKITHWRKLPKFPKEQK